MLLWNALTHKKEKFKPIKRGSARLYTCGPTVYDFSHIGNLRTFIFEDILRRTLKYNGYRVKQVMNITDVEDKIIKRANREKKKISQITSRYTEEFFRDIKKLNVERVEFYPRATKHIALMIKLIGVLLKKRIAYKGKDGSVYFDISKFKNYGRLSGLRKRQLKIGVRIAADEYNKTQAQDFVLWKARKTKEPFWKSPFGEGRPGWHIECSAMSMKYLDKTIDIHTGAVDLIFPHHENEIAQSEAATGKKFVNYWLEGEHLLVQGKKMAKSLNNFYTLRDLEKKGFSPTAFRYLVLGSHYRTKLNFTWQSLKSAETALGNLYKAVDAAGRSARVLEKDMSQMKIYEKSFLSSISDDLNTPKALSVLYAVLKDKRLSSGVKKRLVSEFDKVLGLNLLKFKPKKEAIPLKVGRLTKERERLRANQQFIKADGLRKEIEALGYRVEDTVQGPKVLKKP
ncbi:MAG: cysteine--tRNA ligase [Candidatus Colwellbacteria bacterium]|nr:cysteine--tRNA ligase [Candidatus Colwellbacteria bacterium]